LRFHLFGKFLAQRNQQKVQGLDACKEQELLSYLLIYRNRPHARESLASLLWSNTSTERSKKYLRQAIWHLVSALQDGDAEPRLLQVEHAWVQLNLNVDVWADVAVFGGAFETVQGVAGAQLDGPTIERLKEAVTLYKGDLLEGWYQDWCLFERERFQNMYLTMLDKLLAHATEHGDYEAGQAYGTTILSYDRASELTYRRLMKLRYDAGDRTGAVRQYQRCVTALREELGVKPERRTLLLYERIKSDGMSGPDDSENATSDPTIQLPYVLGRLRRLHHVLTAAQNRVQRDIAAVEQVLKTKPTK
jgi:DNA-binding SARP family transcriptional activator